MHNLLVTTWPFGHHRINTKIKRSIAAGHPVDNCVKPRSKVHGFVLAVRLALVAVMSSSAAPLFAASLTWNSTNGTWDTSTTNWKFTANNTATNWTQTNNTTAVDDAIFAGADGNYTITLSTQIAAGNVTFSNSGYNLTGSALFIPNNGAIIVAANKNATISAKTLGLPNSGTVNMTVNSGAALNLSGGHSATTGATNLGAQLRMQGAGTINISAGDYYTSIVNLNASALNQSGGNMIVTGTGGALNLNNNAGQNVTYTLSGGSWRVESSTSNASQSGMHLTIGRANTSFTGRLVLQSGGNISVGTTSGAVLNIVGKSGDGNGWLDVQGGNLTVGSANAVSQIYFFADGANTSKNATMTQSGGTVTTQGIQFGGSTGTYAASANATLQLTGGNLSIGSLGITRAAGNASVLVPNIVLSGGTLGATANWTSSLGLRFGNGSTTIQAGNSTGSAFNITLSGNLSNNSGQAGSFIKTGNGTLVLSGANTYNGTTTLQAGTLAINSSTAIGASTLSITGGILDNTSGSAITLSNNNAQNWNGDFTFAGTNDLNLGNGAVAMNATRSITVAAGNLTVGGVISGSGLGLTKNGSGTLVLLGNNTYTGATTVNAGTISLGSGGVIGTTSSNLTLANGSALSIGSGAIAAASANVSIRGNSTIFLEGGGQLNVGTSGSVVNFTGGGSVTGFQTNTLRSTGALGAGGNMTVTGSFLRVGSSNSQNYAFTFDNVNVNASGAVFEVGRGGFFNTATITNNAVVTAASATMAVDARDYTLNVNSGGRLVLSGTLAIATGSSTGANNTVNINGGQITGVTGLSFATGANSTSARVNITNGGLLSTGASTVNGTGSLVTVNGTGSHWNLGNATLTLGTMNSTVLVSNGGQITAGSVNAGSGSGIFTLDNGILVAAGANGSISSTGGLVRIRSGGATIDTGAFSLTASANLTEDSGSTGGGLTKNGSGLLTLSGINTYTGTTTINAGTISMASSGSLGAGNYSGNIINNGAIIFGSNTNQTLSGVISGTGALTMNGSGTLVLLGNNTYTGATTVNAGTLRAAYASALGSNNTVSVTGGSLLVTADDAINSKNITLDSSSTTVAGLSFNGTYNGTAGLLTLSENSIIDLGPGSVVLRFNDIVGLGNHTLKIYNWTGETLWDGTNRNNTDQLYVTANLNDPGRAAELGNISFYSDFGNSFLGTGCQLSGSGFYNGQIIPVPEPETYATGIILLLGGAVWMCKRKRKFVACNYATQYGGATENRVE